MDDCVKNLAEKAQYRSDVSLQYIIKLQHITDRLRQSPWYEAYESVESLKVPPAFFIKTLEGQLKDFRKNLPPDQQDDCKSFPSLPATSQTSIVTSSSCPSINPHAIPLRRAFYL